MFEWSGEPVGTETRELRLAGLDGSEIVVPLDGRFSDTVNVKMTGDLGWAIAFKNASGKVLCTSPAGLIRAGAGGGSVQAGGSSLSTTVAGGATAPAPAPQPSVFMQGGRLVIVLQNSPYAGAYTKLINSNDYDGRTEDLQGSSGLEIHGNNAANKIWGSNGADLIFAYGSADYVNAGPGTDTINLGSSGGGIDSFYSIDGEADTINPQGGYVSVNVLNLTVVYNGQIIGQDSLDTGY